MKEIENTYLTVNQFCAKYKGSWPTIGALREIIFNAKKNKNNFQPAFKRIGRRVLISEKIFWKILDTYK